MFQNQQINQSSIFFRKQKNKLKMEELSWLDTEIIPKCGDFSFIKHRFMRISLTFDYNVFKQFEKSGIDVLKQKKNFDDIFWSTVKVLCYPKHTKESFKSSICVLEYIITEGWAEFVIKCINNHL